MTEHMLCFKGARSCVSCRGPFTKKCSSWSERFLKQHVVFLALNFYVYQALATVMLAVRQSTRCCRWGGHWHWRSLG